MKIDVIIMTPNFDKTVNMKDIFNYLDRNGYSPIWKSSEVVAFRIGNFTYFIDCESDFVRIVMAVDMLPLYTDKFLVMTSGKIMSNRKAVKVYLETDDTPYFVSFTVEQFVPNMSFFENKFDQYIRLIRGAWADWTQCFNSRRYM